MSKSKGALLLGKGLTPAELEIARALWLGESPKGFGARTQRSAKTIYCHVSNIHAKLGTHSLAQIILWYERQSVVDAALRASLDVGQIAFRAKGLAARLRERARAQGQVGPMLGLRLVSGV